MAEDRLKLAVFIDFDNIQIGVKDTLGKDFDVSLVLEALKDRGEVVTKIAYGDWPRAGDQSRQMTQHAVQMVQRNVTPRGDKNGADINLALDALEMAFTRDHIGGFAIVGGDSDFIALVEKLKQYDKRVLVVGGRAFTSNILQRNCHEFIAYENLLRSGAGGDGPRSARAGRAPGRAGAESRPLALAFPNVQRALKILAEREVAPQIGLLKSTLLQLDSTFTERDFGASSFLEFMQKLEKAGYIRLRRIERGYLVESVESEPEKEPAAGALEAPETEKSLAAGETDQEAPGAPADSAARAEVLEELKQAVATAAAKSPNRILYMRHIRQALRAADKDFDERRHGFRGLLDLLHQGQREGWLKLQRDRKGVWRIFPVQPPGSISAQPATPTEPLADTAAVSASDSSAPPPEGLAEMETASESAPPAPEQTADTEVPPMTIEESAPTEGAGEISTAHKARKSRAGRGSRKTPSRRKSKEPSKG